MEDTFTGELCSNCPECWHWGWWSPALGMCDDCSDADNAEREHMERISYLLHRAMKRAYRAMHKM
jgi:hypothetical protein